MEVALSVIVPVYNTREYLHECVESVLSQSLKEIELILVDDGSTDGSSQIVHQYADNYANIIALSQDRKRQGAARNLALRHAKGKYVAFLDSDDTIPKDAYRRMYEAAEQNNSDMVVGIQQSFNQRTTWVGVPVHRDEFTRFIPKTTLKKMPALIGDISSCNRMIRRSAIISNNLRFPEGTAGEDLDFMARLYLVADSISVLPEVVYNYRGRTGSRTGRIVPSFFEDRVSVTEDLEEFFRKHHALYIYQMLVRSEVRKLVGNRFAKVVSQSAADEQVQIFETIRRLTAKLTTHDTLYEPDYTLRERVRIIMLRGKEYDALLAYENEPKSPLFIPLIQLDETKILLFEPLMQIKYNELATLSHLLEIQNSRLFSILWRLRGFAVSLVNREKIAKAWRLLKYFATASFALTSNIFFSRRAIWLIDERISSSAEDNAYFFYRYLRTEHPDLHAYYVIDRGSPQLENVTKLGNVVHQYSLKHAYLLWRAKVLASTDGFRSLAYPYETLPHLRRTTHNVFLQHGVAGNKTMTYTKEAYSYFTKVIVTNEIERDFFKNHYGFRNGEVALTGIARFDNLTPVRSAERTRKILVAPTWRRWLKARAQISNSKYYAAWNGFINSDGLAQLLDRYDATLYFRPHFNMLHFIAEFEKGSSRVKVIRDLGEPLHHLIKTSDLLITDYSSVMYDFFFQEKPVIAYMFDRFEWEAQPPGPPHLDYDKDLALNVIYDEDKLLTELEFYLQNNFEMRQVHRDRLEKLFTYRDQQNCERIYRAINADLSKSRALSAHG